MHFSLVLVDVFCLIFSHKIFFSCLLVILSFCVIHFDYIYRPTAPRLYSLPYSPNFVSSLCFWTHQVELCCSCTLGLMVHCSSKFSHCLLFWTDIHTILFAIYFDHAIFLPPLLLHYSYLSNYYISYFCNPLVKQKGENQNKQIRK